MDFLSSFTTSAKVETFSKWGRMPARKAPLSSLVSVDLMCFFPSLESSLLEHIFEEAKNGALLLEIQIAIIYIVEIDTCPT